MSTALLDNLITRRDLRAKELHLTMDAATRDGRDLSPDERTRVAEGTKEIDAIAKDIEKHRGRLDSNESFRRAFDQLAGPVASSTGWSEHRRGMSLGERFVNDEAVRTFVKAGGHKSSSAWTSPPVEFMAATITEDPASGGDLVVPDFRPGIMPIYVRPIVVADLIAPGTTESNAITYMKETSFVNAADTVAEGGTKPESTLVFDAVSDPVRKIAHWIPATEEIIEDVPAMRSYIDSRLRYGLDLAEDDQLLNGTAVAPDIVGFMNRTGLATSIARATEVNADTVLAQIMAIWTATGLQPTGIVMNPTNWKTILLTKDSTGQYYGGGPFASPHAPVLWGVPVALTVAIASGTALIGAFKTASQLFRKGGVRVDMTNAHSTFFIENKVAIRAERREALAVYRPAAFGTVTNLN